MGTIYHTCIWHDITFVTLNSTPPRRPTKLWVGLKVEIPDENFSHYLCSCSKINTVYNHIMKHYIHRYCIYLRTLTCITKTGCTHIKISSSIKSLVVPTGHDAYGANYYQPQKIMVLIREPLESLDLNEPISSLLTEHVINVSLCVWCFYIME